MRAGQAWPPGEIFFLVNHEVDPGGHQPTYFTWSPFLNIETIDYSTPFKQVCFLLYYFIILLRVIRVATK